MIKHNYTLVCDDIRVENNNKILIIGMYTDKMVLPQIPFVLPSLCFFVSLNSDRPGMWHLRVKLQHLETGKNIVEAIGQIGFHGPGLGMTPLRFNNITFVEAGMFQLVIEIEGERDPILVPLEVVLNIPGSQQPGFPKQLP